MHILRQYWQYDDFRPLQAEIISSIGSGQDTLALLPTGGGKSICFQVPAMAMVADGNTDGDGLCLVITPLVALMKDQVMHLNEKRIKAFAIYAGLSHKETAEILDNCQFGHTKFLYVSPERLESQAFRNRLRFLPVAMIAVDEAHCISQWGYDFRPSYLKIADIRELFPKAPVLALTATATQQVVDDIQDKLCFHEKNVFRKSFIRDNLSYVVRYADNKEEMLLHILQAVPGSSIVYVRNRLKSREISDFLNNNGITADFFHAGLPNQEKDARQMAWMKGQTRVMVATNAFGMGIDKANVRTVIHIDLPDTIEAYFQEAGRAGRDQQKAFAVLLYNRNDNTKLQKRVADNFPDRQFIKRVYEAIGDYYEVAIGFGFDHSFTFSIDHFCQQKHLPILPVYGALNILTQAGFLQYTDEQETPPRIQIRCSKEQLYKEELSSLQENLINWLLRQYTGIFSDPVIFSEDNLCNALHLNYREMHATLVEMARNGIITYIPKQKSPHIRYTLDRQPLERLNLTEQQLENKKNIYQEKLMAMLQYAEQNQFCRQQLLVAYFGETTKTTCGCCDVCISNKNIK